MASIEPKSKRVYASGINIHYWDWGGSGPPMVMLHPTSGFGRIWDPIARLLYNDYRLICPDQRGHGDSDKPKSGYAVEYYAADLAAFVKELGLEKIILVGHSLGSRAGMVFAAQHPDSISHLIVVGGPHYVNLFPSDLAEKEYFEQLARDRESAWVRFKSIDEVVQNLRSFAHYSHFSDEVVRHMAIYNTNRNPDGSVEWKWDKAAVGQSLRQLPDDLRPYIKRIKCPILMPYGTRAVDFTPDRVPLVKPFFPTAQWDFIEGGQYSIYFEAPQALVKSIKRFLGQSR